jgi:pteridine reductase
MTDGVIPVETSSVALITGAGVRIGAAIAQSLHADGFNVVIHYLHSGEPAQALALELNAIRANSAMTVQGDIREVASCTEIVANASAWHGRLNVLINNASTFYTTPLGDATLAQWDDLFGSNLKGPFFLSQAAAPALRLNGGSIVNILDAYAARPERDYPIYTAAKAGLMSLTRSLALDLAPQVRVNGVAPGSILWPTDEPDESTKLETLRDVPLQRMGSTQQIARAVRYFVSEGNYVTGQILAVDGGASLS